MGIPTVNSSKQIVHSASSMQSFSVAAYVYMPVRLGGGGGVLPSAATRGLPYVLCDWMQAVMCDSRRASKLGSSREGSSRWQMGHSSSSGI